MLLGEGYIYSKPRSGYFISKIDTLVPIARQKKAVEDRVVAPIYTYNFKTNAVDTKTFPFSTWAKISKDMLYKDLLDIGEGQGDRSLRESIAKYIREFRGVNCTAEQVVVGAGMEYLIGIVSSLLEEKSIFALENPGYYKTYNLLKNLRKKTVLVSVDGQGMRMEELAKTNANIAYLTPSHQFPTGVVMPVGRRVEFLKWAEDEENRYIIEDDYDSEFRFGAKPIPSIQGITESDKVIYISTFSRMLAPSIRIAYMVLPLNLLHEYKQKFRYEASTISRFEQHTLNEFMNSGYFSRHINRSRNLYKKKKDALVSAIRQYLKKGTYEIIGADFGLHLLLRLDTSLSEDTIIQKAKDRSIKVHGISQYYLNGSNVPHKACLVLGYAGMSVEEIDCGIAILADAIEMGN